MELIDAIGKRRSIRKFTNDEIPERFIDEIMEAARLAPSGSNLQPWRFVVIRSDEVKKQLEKITPYKFAAKAPVIIACCADVTVLGEKDQRVGELLETGAFSDVEMDISSSEKYQNSLSESISDSGYLALNVAIAVEHMVLRATDLGLGSCWIGKFNTEKTREILGLPNDLRVFFLLPVGYPAQSPGERPRLSREDILFKTV